MEKQADTGVKSQSGLLAAFLAQLVFSVALGLGIWWLSGRAPDLFVTVDLRQIALGLVLGGVLTGIIALLQRIFADRARALILEQSKRYPFDISRLGWPFIVAISISAGVGEEALFRGGLQTIAGDYLGPVLAIALSNLVFALIHLTRPVLTGILFLIGLYLAIAYAVTDSLIAVMIAHALYDIWALDNMKKVMIAAREQA